MTNSTKTMIQVMAEKKGFIDCFKNQTLYLSPEGKKALGNVPYTQKKSHTA